MNDYRYRIFSTGKYYSKPIVVVSDNNNDKTGYASLYAVSREVAAAIVETGTTAGFKGVVWSERLWLDFDTQEASKAGLKKVKEMELDYVCYNTGGRGYHIGVLRVASPSHLLPAWDRKWASQAFEGLDSSIYTHLHLFRLPGTVHEKSGLRKHLQEECLSGRALTADYSRLQGDRNAMDINCSVDYSNNRSVFDSKRIMYNSVPQDNGDRHPALIRCCYGLLAHSVPSNAARWWIGQVNLTFEERKSEEELDKLVKSIYG